MFDSILKHIDEQNLRDGFNDTYMSNVKVFKASINTQAPYIYEKSIIIVLQGQKEVGLGDIHYTLSSEGFLVVPSTLPLDCKTTIADDKPFIALSVELDSSIIYEILDELRDFKGCEAKSKQEKILYYTFDGIFLDIVKRLTSISQKEVEGMVLGKSILKELYFRLLNKPNGLVIQEAFKKDTIEQKIQMALQKIHKEYDKPLNVQNIAGELDMSVASFHTHFKKKTNFSPLRYYKKIKIAKAYGLLKQFRKVSDVSDKLGYTTPSQFSKEYKKHYGKSPMESIN